MIPVLFVFDIMTEYYSFRITSATTTYILNELLNSTDTRVRSIAESHDWYIFPVTNPDGFVYSHETVSKSLTTLSRDTEGIKNTSFVIAI